MSKATIKGEFVKEQCLKFQNTANKTLARKLYKEAPEFFSSLEDAYGRVRYYRGKSGNVHRATAGRAGSLVPAKTFSYNPFDDIPEPLHEFEDWKAVEVEAQKVLLLNDIHIPYHDKGGLTTALKHAKDRKVDTVILGGDFADFYSCSFWEKDPRSRNLKDEIVQVREFMRILRAGFPKAQIVAKLGNHEERWERYLKVKAPEVLGMEEFEYSKILHLEKHGISLVSEKRAISLGKLFVAHGHEWGEGISSPVNPARGFFMRAKASMIGGHYHSSSSHSEKAIDQEVISTWSTGCLCNLHPAYRPMNKWNHGFAEIEIAKDKNFEVDNFKIINGRVYAA